MNLCLTPLKRDKKDDGDKRKKEEKKEESEKKESVASAETEVLETVTEDITGLSTDEVNIVATQKNFMQDVKTTDENDNKWLRRLFLFNPTMNDFMSSSWYH